MLGHEYFIMGRVVYGRQLGRQLNVPTANIRLQRYRAALEGVYCVTVEGIGDTEHQGIANIGVRPNGGRQRAFAGSAYIRLFRRPVWQLHQGHV